MLSRSRVAPKLSRYTSLIFKEVLCVGGRGFEVTSIRGNVIVSVKGTLSNAMIKGRLYSVNEDDIQWLKTLMLEKSKKFIPAGDEIVQG